MLRYLTLSILLTCVACSQKPLVDPDTLTTKKDTPMAISEVAQSVNVNNATAHATVLEIFRQRRIGIHASNPQQGIIVTKWLPIVDSPCGSYPRSGAPLSCEVEYRVKTQPITAVASSVRIGYTQRCDGMESQRFECPGSNAEKLMLGVISDLKAATGVLDR